ncbi:chymotrypsin-1 isoform X3 [Harpegnathos saltator]|uniref:Chymotrypsin-1 n=1 Tax=Harpegnathos saltator TaxID=610380 RepID=E2B507_HARSA|nr:chymotrypsin-1 isoform X3 [Harpegnathos saltator]EFN89215.1 Chymotrypsin-1 [Harpegnathos saltator]
MMKLAILLVVAAIAKQTYGDEPEAIVGGDYAVLGQIKYIASLQTNGGHMCGGSLISDTHVLTAAHCVEGLHSVNDMTVVTGTINWMISGQTHKIKCIRIHPKYNGDPMGAYKYDIAVITLVKPIIINANQAPIPLANMNYATGNYRGTVCGWGLINERWNIPIFRLRCVEMKILETAHCMKEHTYPQTSKGHMCTKAEVDKAFCSGDSGGPLVANGQLCGIVSWSKRCGGDSPDVYTSVYDYRDFIKESQMMC